MQNEIDARKSSLASLEEIASLRQGDVSEAAIAGMETQRTKISELEAQMDDRLKATSRASSELARVPNLRGSIPVRVPAGPCLPSRSLWSRAKGLSPAST